MSETFQSLGFQIPKVMVNSYGIKIYIGHKDRDDWGAQIPNKLLPEEIRAIYKQPYDRYFITESEALSEAEKFTKIAKENDNED